MMMTTSLKQNINYVLIISCIILSYNIELNSFENFREIQRIILQIIKIQTCFENDVKISTKNSRDH